MIFYRPVIAPTAASIFKRKKEMEEKFLNFIDKTTKILAVAGMVGFVHVALRLAEAFEKGLL